MRGFGGGEVMTPEQQQDALRCAELIEDTVYRHWMLDELAIAADAGSKYIRVLVDRVQDLEAQLEAIGAGGVSGQRITKKGEEK